MSPEGGLYTLISHQAHRVDEACLDVLRLEPRVRGQDSLRPIPGGEHPEDMLHGQPAPAEDRLLAEDLGIHGDAPKEFILLLGFVLRATPGRLV